MNDRELARVLVEKLADANINKKIAVYVNRLLLRLHSQPALMANLSNVTAFKPDIEGNTEDQVKDGSFHEALTVIPTKPEAEAEDQKKDEDEDQAEEDKARVMGDDDDSTVLVQLSFRRLPQEILSPLLRLIAAPREPKLYRFVDDGQARTGIQLELKPSDFPGDDYEYAF